MCHWLPARGISAACPPWACQKFYPPHTGKHVSINVIFHPMNLPDDPELRRKLGDEIKSGKSFDSDYMQCISVDPEQDPQTPYFYISDTDDLLLVDDEKDYSIIVSDNESGDPDKWDNYKNNLGGCYYGTKRYERGSFLPECEANDLDDKDNYSSEITSKAGVERIIVKVENEQGNAAVQSRGDALFVLTHGAHKGWPHPDYKFWFGFAPFPTWDTENCIQHESTFIRAEDLAAVTDTEIDWIISEACSILNNRSFEYWQTSLIESGSVESICAYRDQNYYANLPYYSTSGPSTFFGEFSDRLTNYNDLPTQPFWWKCAVPNDAAIVAWMENACRWTRGQDPSGKGRPRDYSSVSKCAAIDLNNRYVITSTYSSFSKKLEWMININNDSD